MTKEDLKSKELELLNEYNSNLHLLREAWVKNNAEFSVGDFIYNVTGIIKIDSIKYSEFRGNISIEYWGLRYKKANGILSRTKDNKQCKLEFALKKI